MPEPSEQDVADATRLAANRGGQDVQLQNNHLFALLYNRETGIYSAANGRRLSRRRWIETYFWIVNKKGKLVPLILNRAQRTIECTALRMERASMPVRIQICKERQVGSSSYVQAFGFETILRGQNEKGLICADTKDRSELLLRIANTARRKMPKSDVDGDYYDWKMSSKAKYAIGWAAPIDGLIEITSSEVDRPGMSGTRRFVHLSESSHFVDPESAYPSILASLPSEPFTYAFDESTANGDRGMFRDNWWSGWEERDVPLRGRKNQWVSLFFAFWQHEEYFYSKTYGGGHQPSPEMIADISATLDDEEKWLLEQRYWVRGRPGMEWEEVPCILDRPGTRQHGKSGTKWRIKGCGWTNVNYDQLAWRRAKLRDKEIHGDINLLHQEYPASAHQAFISTGNRVFPADVLERYARKAEEPVWRGSLEEPEVALNGREDR